MAAEDGQPLESETYTGLSGFQRDLLVAISTLGEEPHGLGIKSALEEKYGEDINHGRLYNNLDKLVDAGYLEKGTIDRRTNYYTLTASGRRVLQQLAADLVEAAGFGAAPDDRQ